MKKLKFNCPLDHKPHSFDPMQVEVEKVITLYGKRFEQMKEHPPEDCYEIAECADLMYQADGVAHCVLFLDANGSDGILVESEGCDYARKAQFIPNARALIESTELTAAERMIHHELREVADKIAELAHAGDRTFYFDDVLGNTNLKAMMIQAVAEMLGNRYDLAQVKDCYLDIPCQPDFTVTPKETQEMKFYSPLTIQAEPQVYESDWDEPFDDEYEELTACEAVSCEEEINQAIMDSYDSNEEHRGLMVYFDNDSPIYEKIFSAFPSVEIRDMSPPFK